MDRFTCHPLHSGKPPSPTPYFSSKRVFFLPCHSHLKASWLPHSFLINAVLADRPASSRDPDVVSLPSDDYEARPKWKQGQSLEQQIALSEVKPPVSKLPLNLRLKKAGQNKLGREDTELESTWVHRLWVVTGSSAMVGMMGKAIEAAGRGEGEGMGMIASAMAAYVLADLATGIYHWGIDNYGDAETPVFGSQIDAFQGHHKRPRTIARRQFANNIHALARPATFALAPLLLLPSHAYVDCFLSVFLACVVYSQQFHAWAHTEKKEVPQLVVGLQEMGLLVSRKMHGAHHRPPYDINYCIVSGLWNPLLDRVSFFATLELFVFSTFHVRPRCWGETSVDWLEDGS